MSKKNEKLDKMAALRKLAILDVPPVIAKSETPAPPAAGKLIPYAGKTGSKLSRPQGASVRERTAVNLSPAAIDALKKIKMMLTNEGDDLSASASAAMCVALEYTAGELAKNKPALLGLFAAFSQSDKRRA